MALRSYFKIKKMLQKSWLKMIAIRENVITIISINTY